MCLKDPPQSCIVGWRMLVAAWNEGGGKGGVCWAENQAGLLYFEKFKKEKEENHWFLSGIPQIQSNYDLLALWSNNFL